jgi:hypothetical protein
VPDVVPACDMAWICALVRLFNELIADTLLMAFCIVVADVPNLEVP